MRQYRLRDHPLVTSDFEDIFDLIAPIGGVVSAHRITDEIADSIATLAERPHQGTKRDEILPNLRAIPSAKKGVIAFRVDDNAREVHVLCISYAGKDWQSRSKRRAQTMP